jgi:hypothetical protein
MSLDCRRGRRLKLLFRGTGCSGSAIVLMAEILADIPESSGGPRAARERDQQFSKTEPFCRGPPMISNNAP